MMTLRVKLRDLAADGGVTDILRKPLNLRGLRSVVEDRAAGNGDGGVPVRMTEREELMARLKRMSLGALLYYVLAGEGMIADEPV